VLSNVRALDSDTPSRIDGRKLVSLPWVPRDTAGLEALILDVAARSVAGGAAAIDGVVVDGLRQIAARLHLDVAILAAAANHGLPVVTHHWTSDGRPPADPCPLASWSLVDSALATGKPAYFNRVDDVATLSDRDACLASGVRSAVVLPLPGAETLHQPSVLAFASRAPREWSLALVGQLRLAASVFSQALERKAALQALHAAQDELRQLRGPVGEPLGPDGFRDEPHARSESGRERGAGAQEGTRPTQVRGEIDHRLDGLTGTSEALGRVLAQARQVARTDSTVLLLGETGTGKELIASYIHAHGSRRGREMVRVNCAAIPGTLIESELFGREKGAFTGAVARQAGRFELAHRATIFLDEIGDLPAEVQVKLLRVLEERQIERLGSPRSVHVDVRIIAATHRDLEKHVADNEFREDLFYRLNVFPIRIPPLRERREDIPQLVWRFVAEFSAAFGRRIETIPADNLAELQQYRWPGNIRELRNVVERAMIVVQGTELRIKVPAAAAPPAAAVAGSSRIVDVEREHIRGILETARWRIRGAGGAAERLGLRPTTLETRMAKLGIVRPGR
jgi:transcriptional regulator with GAF, ATPase, and Fis domain